MTKDALKIILEEHEKWIKNNGGKKADLSWANLSGADLSEAHFERTDEGYIAYKIFGAQYVPPQSWKIEPNSVIEETVNSPREKDCGSGVNVAPLEWVRTHYHGGIWKVLIEWPWLAGVIVPYNTDGKIRCERVSLLEIVEG